MTWCPKAIAGIGKLPDTVVDRSLVLNLERRPANAEPLPRWRDRDREAIERLKRQLTCWVADNEEAILAARASVSYPPPAFTTEPEMLGNHFWPSPRLPEASGPARVAELGQRVRPCVRMRLTRQGFGSSYSPTSGSSLRRPATQRYCRLRRS